MAETIRMKNNKKECVAWQQAPAVFVPDLWDRPLASCGSSEDAGQAVSTGYLWPIVADEYGVSLEDRTRLDDPNLTDQQRAHSIGHWSEQALQQRLESGEIK